MPEAAGGNKGAPFLGHKGSGSEGMWGTQPCRKQEHPDYVNTDFPGWVANEVMLATYK